MTSGRRQSGGCVEREYEHQGGGHLPGQLRILLVQVLAAKLVRDPGDGFVLLPHFSRDVMFVSSAHFNCLQIRRKATRPKGVILSALVHDPDVTVRRGFRIGYDTIQFADLERGFVTLRLGSSSRTRNALQSQRSSDSILDRHHDTVTYPAHLLRKERLVNRNDLRHVRNGVFGQRRVLG